MRLVDDQIAPVELLKYGLLANTHLIGGHANVPLARHEHISNESVTGVLVTNKADGSEGRAPLLKLIYPILKR